jgi:hypothetical protein
MEGGMTSGFTDLIIVERQFIIQYQSLCDVQKALIDHTARIAGFPLLVIGWILTSDGARSYLSQERSTLHITVIVIVVVYFLVCCASWVAYRESKHIFHRMNELNFLPVKSYANRLITREIFTLYAAGNGVLALLLIAILLRIPR